VDHINNVNSYKYNTYQSRGVNLYLKILKVLDDS